MFEFDNHYHHLMPNLPVELQSIIVKCLSDPDDFHSLARVSRDLNFLAVRELCSMYCLNLQKGMLTFDAKTFRVVPTLAISLYMFGASIEVLNCNLTDTQEQPELLKQTHSLRNFVSALSSVQRANFFFNNCGTVEWEDMIIAVCDVLVNRRCSDLQIKTLARSTAHPGRSNKLAMLIQKLSAPVAGKREVPCSVRQSIIWKPVAYKHFPHFSSPSSFYSSTLPSLPLWLSAISTTSRNGMTSWLISMYPSSRISSSLIALYLGKPSLTFSVATRESFP